jgi:Coenzyme PQQ synthesis protein D (PqqD)
VLDPSTHPRVAAGLEVNEAEDGLVVYVEATETVHHLNKTAAVIFALCDGTRNGQAVADEVARLFSLDGSAFSETLACLAELEEKQLIEG